MAVTVPFWQLAVVLAAVAILMYGIGHTAGRSSGKVEAYEQELDIDRDG